MNISELESGIKQLCTHLFGALTDKPIVKQQIMETQPLKVRTAVRIPGVEPETVMDILRNGLDFSVAFKKVWPVNVVGGRHSKSITIAGDDRHVLFDLTLYNVTLEAPASLTPGEL